MSCSVFFCFKQKTASEMRISDWSSDLCSSDLAATPWPSRIGLPADTIAPVVRAGLVELPVTLIEDAPGSLRNVQVCALSIGEIRAALDHAVAEDHAAVTIVSHSFELANRAGTRANGIHARRFEALCEKIGRAHV